MYRRGDVVLVNYPFVTEAGVQQKLRPALVISDPNAPRRFPDDVMLAAITSQHVDHIMPNEVMVRAAAPDFPSTGLKVTSLVRLDFLMTVPSFLIRKAIGRLSPRQMTGVDECSKRSMGLK
ncbi:MAG: type II toxin-antitoxin system PemK/MazF family toxin [Planctomycetes bacterium]|nr:type II toxin-antitoxin system PemK/MazF family toxin [Planctomycetota bacterium]